MIYEMYSFRTKGQNFKVTAANEYKAREEVKNRFGLKKVKMEYAGIAHIFNGQYNYTSIENNSN